MAERSANIGFGPGLVMGTLLGFCVSMFFIGSSFRPFRVEHVHYVDAAHSGTIGDPYNSDNLFKGGRRAKDWPNWALSPSDRKKQRKARNEKKSHD